jgi:two-component system, LytTR family, sensor kinase
MQKQNFNKALVNIIIHLLAWSAFFFIPSLFIEGTLGKIHYFYKAAFYTIAFAIFFYLNQYILIPKFLLNKRVQVYVLIIISSIVLITVVNEFYINLIRKHIFLDVGRHDKKVIPLVFSALMIYGLSTSLKIIGEWFKKDKQQKEIENEKLNTELAFLKSQVNPHFLFNTLNNICALARKKSDSTEDAIIRLSQIMRYMYYDSRDDKVNLEKEVEYLNNYIDLQKLRVSDLAIISFDCKGDIPGCMIEPMLLIPFVENSFKHGISTMNKSAIKISLEITDQQLVFEITNPIWRSLSENIEKDSGIGLKNVKRRLNLLYPHKHNLLISDNGETYKVVLTIVFGEGTEI